MTVAQLRAEIADVPDDATVWIEGQAIGYYDEPETTEAQCVEKLRGGPNYRGSVNCIIINGRGGR